MKSRFFIQCALLMGILFYLLNGTAFAYDDQTTHPALTDEIVDFYNHSNPQKPVTAEQKEWIVQGSILEDTPPRWINHFYDPINNISWNGEHAGRVPAGVARLISFIFFSVEKPLTAVEWVNSFLIQNTYSLYQGDRTWKRGLKHYADGDQKEAYITLGHALHLLEDMTVPEHTRNDPHVHEFKKITGDYGSPYEEYTKKWARDTLRVTEELIRKNIRPMTKSSIDEYVTSLALYSNKYFFSKDTIYDPAYVLPKILSEDGDFGYGADEYGIKFPLVAVKMEIDPIRGKIPTGYYIPENDGDSRM